MEAEPIREDFAGPGGWSEGLKALDLHEQAEGFEHDESACDTARAAGHRREQVDVRALREAAKQRWPHLWGLITSPPCQTFSRLGNGEGRTAIDDIRMAADAVRRGMTPEQAIALTGSAELDERSLLVLEPLYVAASLRPQWVAMEQVPAVLPVWEAIAVALEGLGYHTTVGMVSSETYGVPQTRKRAVLLAHQDRAVALPAHSHSRYHTQDGSKLDVGVPPWVSMAEGLGWPLTDAELLAVVLPRVHNQSGTEFDLTWPAHRPAPVIAGREIVTMPGANANRFNGSTKSRNDGLKVSVAEAGVLQSFRADYPWSGVLTKQREQVGNCVPPLMAAALLWQLVDQSAEPDMAELGMLF